MSEKRRDDKNRLLRTGESQRKNGTYEFKYTDANGKRHSVYSHDLPELREKEKQIQRALDDGIDYSAGDITLIGLVERYLKLKGAVRENTKISYNFVMGVLRKENFAQRKIRDIKVSDAKLWFIKLHEDDYSYSTICTIRGVVKPAFQMAYEDDVIRRNPFCFKLDVIPNDTRKRIALTPQQQRSFLSFIKNDEHFCQYYDEIIVLLGTGMRISEFCGLTIADLDFDRRRIRVDHQLIRQGQKLYIEETKTECGKRFIPMTDEVYQSLYNILAARKKRRITTEVMVDGRVGFLLLDINGKPKVAMHYQHTVKRIWQKYNEVNVIPLPLITPHVFRHTFCTNMANAGMDLKSLQYLMGHSDASVTLNVYMHNSYEMAEQAMAKVTQFPVQQVRSV